MSASLLIHLLVSAFVRRYYVIPVAGSELACRICGVAFLLFCTTWMTAGEPKYFGGDPVVSTNRPEQSLVTDLHTAPYSAMMIPVITTRFANPHFDCETSEYCVDVEFQSDIEDQELFGMNVRFFYDDNVLELINFRDFQGGYGPLGPNPPTILTSGPGFGTNFFGFPAPGIADWVNGSIQLIDQNAPPVYISTTEWTKLFQICFTIDDPDPDSLNFCPSIVWDLEQNPANGGYLAGDDGVVMTVVAPPPANSGPSTESVVHLNWQYIGNGMAPPYGAPIETDCISLGCGIAITCPADIFIDCGEATDPSNTGTATASDFCPGDPLITFVDSLAAGICGEPNQIFRTWTAMDGCSNVSSCQQIITIDDRGSICGYVYSELGQPIPGVKLRLVVDANSNESFDVGDVVIDSTYSDVNTGEYCFNLVEPCAYIIEEIQPLNHTDLSDFDYSPDPEGDDSADGPDNEIPVLLSACEADTDNSFLDIVCPGNLPLIEPDTICENGSVILDIEDINIGLTTYSWDFGSGSSPLNGSGLGPHVVSYTATMQNQSPGADITLTVSKAGCPDASDVISHVTVNTYPDPTIDGSTANGCYFTNRVFVPLQDEIPGATYEWNFGERAVPETATGYGPHTVYYDTSGMMTVSLVIHPNTPGAQCPDSATLSFTITACPGTIIGTVKSVANAPIANVNVRLYADADTNGIADNNIDIKNVYTTNAGVFTMVAVFPGHYVIYQQQPVSWDSYSDGDLSVDNDIVDNIDLLDNLIPVTLVPSEVDQGNYFTETPTLGAITGNVFMDFDADQIPDSGEGLENVAITLLPDANTDGVADSGTPVATTYSLASGAFSMTNIAAGHYVLVETQPFGFISIKDIDTSNDSDAVPNTDMHNDTIPVSLTNGEVDAHNYFIDADSCGILVTSLLDDGIGTLRQAIECAQNNDTIRFHSTLSGATITINSARILIEKNLVIYCTTMDRVNITSQIVGLFDIAENYVVEFRQLDIVSGLSGNLGAAFKNQGTLKLHDVNVLRNPLLPPGEYLIHNNSTSQLFLNGSCFLEMN